MPNYNYTSIIEDFVTHLRPGQRFFAEHVVGNTGIPMLIVLKYLLKEAKEERNIKCLWEIRTPDLQHRVGSLRPFNSYNRLIGNQETFIEWVNKEGDHDFEITENNIFPIFEKMEEQTGSQNINVDSKKKVPTI
jgi:hypothetical protein